MNGVAPQPNNIRLTLTTADGRVGVCLLIPDDQPMVWDHEGDDETVEARFEHFDEKGELIVADVIDGDDWRKIEDTGELPYVAIWVRRGCGLEAAIGAAVMGCDPDGYDNDYETALEDKEEQLKKLEAAIRDIVSSSDNNDGGSLANAINAARNLLPS